MTPTPEALPPLPAPFGYVSDGGPNGLMFQHQQWSPNHCLIHSVAPVYSHAQISVIRAEAYAAGRASLAMGEGEPVGWAMMDGDKIIGRLIDRKGVAEILERAGETLRPLKFADTAQPAPAAPVSDERIVSVLTECIDLAWIDDSHAVRFDSTVMFGPSYDFSGLDGSQRQEFHGQHSAVVWPSSGIGKTLWSAYCTFDGSLWFERFATSREAKEACMLVLDKALPDHPAMKARAILSLHPAPAKPMNEDAARLDWLRDNLFVHRWNGALGAGCAVHWGIAPDHRHTMHAWVQKDGSTTGDFRLAIDAARGITAQAGEAS